jgi:hypothetical protein
MELENKVLGKVGFVSPDNPPNTYIAQPKLVTTSHNNLAMILLIRNLARTRR